jgi:hypothetical protein
MPHETGDGLPAGKEVGIVQLGGGASGLVEQLQPPLALGFSASPARQVDELERNLRERGPAFRRGGQAAQQLDGPPIVGNGLRPGVQCAGPRGRPQRLNQRAIPLLRPLPVVSEKRRVLGRDVAEDVFEVACNTRMENLAFLTQDARVGRLLGQRVLEDVLPLRAARPLADELRA